MMHQWASLPDTLVPDSAASMMTDEVDAQRVEKEIQRVMRGQKYCENQYRETRRREPRPRKEARETNILGLRE